MDVPIWMWAITVGGIVAMLVVDFVGHVRTPHAPTLKESATWSIVYVAIAIAFGFVVWGMWGSGYAGEYFAGYITEKSLSVDNLFVFVLIMASFKVPREFQQKVLLLGIVIALALRTVFIFAGATIIEHLAWVFYIFGAFLLYTAWTQIKGSGHDPEEGYQENAMLRMARRVLPTTDDYVGDRFVTRVDGKRLFTPLFIVMIAIGTADLIFAVDSIPAIFGLTQEVFLVFTANAFSLLGLRQLFFLIDGLLDRLVYLSYGLGAILAFIGVKLLIHALHTNELPFINGGEHVETIPEPSIAVSLSVIVGILTVTVIASLLKERSDTTKMGRKAAGIHHMSEEARSLAARQEAAERAEAAARPDATETKPSDS